MNKRVSVPLKAAAEKVIKHAPVREDNRTKFVRLANGRVNAALHSIRLIGNLANRTLYDYNDNDVVRIKEILSAAVKVAVDRFDQRDRQEWVFDVEGDEVVPANEE